MVLNFNNNYLYTLVEMQRYAMEPWRQFATMSKDFHGHLPDNKISRSMAAGYELFERMTRNYPKPEFDIKEVEVNGKPVAIEQITLISKTFCNLLHFKKEGKFNQPKMLVVAPMSGHHATLLRGTVKDLLPFFDVYITDWVNARDVPVDDGYFRFDDFVNYIVEFMKTLGPNLHVMAVCQPSVPVLAAVSMLSSENDPMRPDTLILIGGSVDSRKNPTEVNDYAAERTILWFENNVITKVPMNYPGTGRSVYPGFTQLFGFMAMNLQAHVEAHWDLFKHLVEGDGESAIAHKKFYNEYLAVMDLPAEFYLDTVNVVFKKHLLPRGKLVCSGKKVIPSDIKDTFLLCIEGEKDDISGRGQTKAAMKVCENIPESKKKYYLQNGVGHYGIFNGKKYRECVVPVIQEFVEKSVQAHAKSTQPKARKPAKPGAVKKAKKGKKK